MINVNDIISLLCNFIDEYYGEAETYKHMQDINEYASTWTDWYNTFCLDDRDEYWEAYIQTHDIELDRPF